MTREEILSYRRSCPYDAMEDYSVFLENEDKKNKDDRTEKAHSDHSDGNR